MNLNLTEDEINFFSQGHFSGQQLKYRKLLLDETLKPLCNCVEVGVFQGDFSEFILKYYDPKKLILVDSWTCSEISGDTLFAAEMGKCPQSNFDTWENEVREKFKNDARVEIVKKYSVDAAKDFEDGSLDWVYIDAAHHYQAVLNDLNAWMPKVKSGGYLCGDDFLINDIHCYGVIDAAHKFLNFDKLTLEENIDHEKYGHLHYKVIGYQFYIHKI